MPREYKRSEPPPENEPIEITIFTEFIHDVAHAIKDMLTPEDEKGQHNADLSDTPKENPHTPTK